MVKSLLQAEFLRVSRARPVVPLLSRCQEPTDASRQLSLYLLSTIIQSHFQVQEERIFHQQVKCVITDEKTCRVCKKKIGNR